MRMTARKALNALKPGFVLEITANNHRADVYPAKAGLFHTVHFMPDGKHICLSAAPLPSSLLIQAFLDSGFPIDVGCKNYKLLDWRRFPGYDVHPVLTIENRYATCSENPQTEKSDTTEESQQGVEE